MKKYQVADLSERELEDIVRKSADLIEEGARYIDHQKMTDRGSLDVLMVDSGGSLIVAELKIIEDDSMLMQGVDYYDYVVKNLEAFARIYKDFNINPTQTARLFLIAPSFSLSLLNRCKWLDLPISLFIYKCITLEEDKEITPIYTEITIPSALKVIEHKDTENNLNYITNSDMLVFCKDVLKEIQDIDKSNISVDPTKNDLSLKAYGSVFAYLCPRRNNFVIYTYDKDNNWKGYPIHQKEDFAAIKPQLDALVHSYAK